MKPVCLIVCRTVWVNKDQYARILTHPRTHNPDTSVILTKRVEAETEDVCVRYDVRLQEDTELSIRRVLFFPIIIEMRGILA